MNLDQITIYSDKPMETVEFFRSSALNLSSIPCRVTPVSNVRMAKLPPSVQHDEKAIVLNNLVFYFERKELDSEVGQLKSLGLVFDEDSSDRDWL